MTKKEQHSSLLFKPIAVHCAAANSVKTSTFRDNNWNIVQSIENIRGGLVVNVVY
jgi:hypothetical protein